jgi:peptide/nickel transport system permease protein
VFVARLIAQRFILALFTLLLVSFLIFAVLEILPGDVATRILGRDATQETIAALRLRMHLDDPALLRYFRWL